MTYGLDFELAESRFWLRAWRRGERGCQPMRACFQFALSIFSVKVMRHKKLEVRLWKSGGWDVSAIAIFQQLRRHGLRTIRQFYDVVEHRTC